MKILFLLTGVLLSLSSAHAESFNWDKLKRDRIDLKLPLLTIQGEKGWLACAYLNVSICDKTGEACAIVSGVNNHTDMLAKPIIAVSKAASELGVVLGMSGEQALQLMR